MREHKTTFTLFILPLLSCAAFIFDLLVLYTFNYPLSHAKTSVLAYGLFHKKPHTILIAILLFLCFWQLAYSAPLTSLLFVCGCYGINRWNQTYLYPAPIVPFLASAGAILLELIVIRIIRGHWPFEPSGQAILYTILFNSMAIFALFMIYYRYGKQGNR